MIRRLSVRHLLGLGFAVILSQAVNAEGLTVEEANTIVKEDIAAAQVMAEVCPAIIGKNAKLDSNIQALIETYLADLKGQTLSYSALQADAEYKNILIEARDAAKETTADEQKTVCQDAAAIEL
ncbi:MCR_0457 family protein [Acinetobacter indicus]|uniref:MCR_0457 family protein n=1 Tax=Acinetobacter indicus TaxID=756892 RepID=UPI0014443407|nr:hypothetical protein [Acinetobacter indicus]NOJ67677.1 hypothetical protein [Acinetobacter indicus]